MSIRRFAVARLRMPLSQPYTIAYETVDRAVNVLLAMETDAGEVGYGCAAPDPGVTGETAEGTLAALQDVAEPLLYGQNPLRWVRRLEELKPLLAERPSALAAIDMTLAEGEFACILGPSGCGKSTLLNIIAGFEGLTAGEARVFGEGVAKPGPDRAVVFQEASLFPWLTVWQNVTFGPRMLGRPKEETDALARKYPNAGRQWTWQYVFPARARSVDPRDGVERRHHVDEGAVQKAAGKVKEAARDALKR